jgi:hypothetical protein
MAARKNYSFEKNQRARAKAAKREAKREQKLAKKREEEGVEGEPGAMVDGGEAAADSTDSTTSEGGAG